MPKKKQAERSLLGDLARPRPMPEQGSRARRPEPVEWPPADTDSERTEHMRVVTLALGRNLSQVHWAWERPVKAYEHVSVPMQQVTTFLSLVTLFPLERMLADLADDWQAMRKVPEWVIPDLKLDHADSFLVNLPQWRQAVALGHIEVLINPRARDVAGLRAWLPQAVEPPAWSMTLDNERLSGMVESLMKALPAWDAPPQGLKLPSAK